MIKLMREVKEMMLEVVLPVVFCAGIVVMTVLACMLIGTIT